jgi:two-component system phosphate regulon sensor histidine kinase PhoR
MRANLEGEVRELADLLAKRQRRRPAEDGAALEQEIVSAIPWAAALVSKEGWVRVSNALFDTLAASGRAAGLTPLEITRSRELSEAVKRALEGTARRLELAIGGAIYLARVAPLLRGEVLLLLRDVTDARRAETARKGLIANASHELRTPISAIRAAAETLLSGALAELDTARGFVEIVGRNAERLEDLTEKLLDLSRIESGEWRFEIRMVDAAASARQAIELLAPSARDHGLSLRSEVPADAAVRADARALDQVLVNLVDNAVKYTIRGDVTVRAEREEKHWVLSVVDTGPGIEPQHLSHIFERFYRVDAGRSREQGGSGLGLAIVKHLVHGMAGEIGVESGAEGSRFWVRLPAA